MAKITVRHGPSNGAVNPPSPDSPSTRVDPDDPTRPLPQPPSAPPLTEIRLDGEWVNVAPLVEPEPAVDPPLTTAEPEPTPATVARPKRGRGTTRKAAA